MSCHQKTWQSSMKESIKFMAESRRKEEEGEKVAFLFAICLIHSKQSDDGHQRRLQRRHNLGMESESRHSYDDESDSVTASDIGNDDDSNYDRAIDVSIDRCKSISSAD